MPVEMIIHNLLSNWLDQKAMREITSISRRTPLPSHPVSSFLPSFSFVFYQNAFKMGLLFIYISKSLSHHLILCGATLPKLLLRSCLSRGELLGHIRFCTVFISIASSFVSKVSLVRRKPLCQGTWSGVCAPRQWHLSWGLHAAFQNVVCTSLLYSCPSPTPAIFLPGLHNQYPFPWMYSFVSLIVLLLTLIVSELSL